MTELKKAIALKALQEFADAAKRQRQVPYRTQEAWNVYKEMFDDVIDIHIPVLTGTEVVE